MNIAEMVEILLKILKEVDEIYHAIVEERDDGKDDDSDI